MKSIIEELKGDVKQIVDNPCKEYCHYKLGLIELEAEKKNTAEQMTEVYKKQTNLYKSIITLCKGTGCQSSGEVALKQKFEEVLAAKGMTADVHFV